jgi:hypothetical protein
MKNEKKETGVVALTNLLSALTANQATIIELLYHKLSALSEDERITLEGCANKNYEIAESLQAVAKTLRGK